VVLVATAPVLVGGQGKAKGKGAAVGRRLHRRGIASVSVAVLAWCFVGVAREAGANTATAWLEQDSTYAGAPTGPSAADQALVSAAVQAPSVVQTVPFWQSTFTYNGTTYPFQMVGTDPAQAGQTTTVPTVVIPIDVTFKQVLADASPQLDGSSITAHVVSSPLFQPAPFAATGDVTQYGDAIQRAEFATVVHDLAHYHVLLGQPRVAPTANVVVPSAKGYVEDPLGDGVSRGHVTDSSWWVAQLLNLLDANGITSNELPIFVTRDVAVGFALGFHGALLRGDQIVTFAWASWLDTGWAVPYGFSSSFGPDMQLLGHEVAEWLNDPFVDNATPRWLFSLPPLIPSACISGLEVGDPLEMSTFPVALGSTTYYFQDAAFLSWFARQSPSIGYMSRYSFTGTFTTYSTPC
jgi:hypothetical protein